MDAITGAGVQAKLTIAPQRDTSGEFRIGGTLGSSDPEGAFAFEGLSPGTYGIAASTPDGACGILRGLELAPGARVEDLVVRVQPGARLRVRYDGPEEVGNFRVFDGDAVVVMDAVEPGTSEVFTVPAGRLQVQCGDLVHEVTLDVGALVDVRFGPDEDER